MRAEDRETLAKRIVERSGADQTEVLVSSGDHALTRFTHEVSNQNVAVSSAAVSVRAIVGGRTGVAQTNRVEDDAELTAVVERAIAMARLAPGDPLAGDLPRGGPSQAPEGAYDPETARAGADVRAQMCEAIFKRAEAAGCWSAGFASTSSTGFTIANSSGNLSSFDGTDAAVNVKMNAADSTGFAEAYAPAIAKVDADAAGATAARKARDGAAPRAVEPGAWTVVFEPPAFGELFVYLAAHFGAQAFEEGSSFCSDGLDRKYFSENLTVYDDFANPLMAGMPFDFEGQPTRRLPLVENGVVRNIVTDSYYARKLGRENTGHALPAPNAYGPLPRNIAIAGGSKPVEELIAQTERGLLVTRLWYIRTVDRKKAIVTGMTRDGTFAIEKGRVTHGVRNLRFNHSLLDMLNHVELGSEQRRSGSYHYSLVAPAARVEGFTFTSTTEF